MKKIIYLFLLFISTQVSAQEEKVRYKSNAIFSLSAHSFIGDVCPQCGNLGLGLSASSRFRFVKSIFFRPEFAYQRLQAAKDPKSMLTFKNNTFSAILNLEYALVKDKHRTDGRANKEFFLNFAPILMHQNPFTKLENKKVFLASYQTEAVSYSKFVLGIKLGLSADFKLKKENRIGFFADYQLFLSAYLDDVSQNYIDYTKAEPNRSKLIDPTQKAEIKTKRGNNSKFDSLLRVGLSFEFGFKTP
jgi:hypothetical protein